MGVILGETERDRLRGGDGDCRARPMGRPGDPRYIL